jgi:hypothetical protein
MYEDGRLGWRISPYGWLVRVDRKHLATETDFDAAIRTARQRFESGCRRPPKAGDESEMASGVVVSFGQSRMRDKAD